MAAPEPGVTTMRSLHITKYSAPSDYQVGSVPIPAFTSPTDVLIRCKAASINPGDVKMANGNFKLMNTTQFPFKLFTDVSGTVVAIGEGVDLANSKIQIGDDVYTQLPLPLSGAASEYAVCPISRLSHKPRSISHTEAASVPAVFFTAYEMMERAEAILRSSGHSEGLKGKTVFVSSGLSGTGSAAAQVAKHVYGAARVVASLSTGKIGLVDKLLPPGTIDVVFDYQKEDIASKEFSDRIGGEDGRVDVYFDTAGTVMQAGHLGIIKKGGVVITITSIVTGEEMEKLMKPSWLVKKIMDLGFKYYSFTAGRQGVQWDAILAPLRDGGQLDEVSRWIDEGKVKPVVGKVAKLSDLAGVIEISETVLSGKGGVGKYVVEVD